MELEPRPKNAGCKIHLEVDECQEILDWLKEYGIQPEYLGTSYYKAAFVPFKVTKQIAKAMRVLLKEHPDMLKPRTPEQIKEALEVDHKKTGEALSAIKAGGSYKKEKK